MLLATLNVPVEKSKDYKIQLFYFLSENIEKVAAEYGKWPDKVTFLGKLGKELIDVIYDMKWDLSTFNITYEKSIVHKIMIEYSKPLDEIEDLGYINGDSINGKEVGGIPTSETMSKLNQHVISTNFKIERKIRPTAYIKLSR